MKEMFVQICWWSAWVCAILTLLGFLNPSLLLWWEDTQYRMKVLKIYGTGFLFFMILYMILETYW